MWSWFCSINFPALLPTDLAGVVDSIGTAQGDPLSQKPPPIPAAGSSTSTNPGSTVPPQQPANTPPPPSKKEYDARYYSGFFTTDIKQDNNANVTDNLEARLAHCDNNIHSRSALECCEALEETVLQRCMSIRHHISERIKLRSYKELDLLQTVSRDFQACHAFDFRHTLVALLLLLLLLRLSGLIGCHIFGFSVRWRDGGIYKVFASAHPVCWDR
eukprot:1157221-Pelagomonas_calceolata.AAC.12